MSACRVCEAPPVDDDRFRFLALLAATVVRFGWRLYAWVLMTNHFHLEVETPEEYRWTWSVHGL